MPNILIVHSSNILEKDNLNQLLPNIHNLLVEKLPTKLNSCKSRIIISDSFFIADGTLNKAFVNMEIKILKGRDRELVNSIGHEIIAMLDQYFTESINKLDAAISLEISEFTDFYYKR